MNRPIRLLFAIVLVCSLIITSVPHASATSSNLTNDYTVSFTANAIIEHVSISPHGTPILVTRTTYTDNTAVVVVVEHRNTSTFSYSVNYNALYHSLSHQQEATTAEVNSRSSGYVYTPMKSEVFTDYLTPENGQISTILACVSIVLGNYNLPLSTITAIASLIYAGSYAPYETMIITEMDWYFKTLDGEFISYYCEYTVTTYVKDTNGNWVNLGPKTGTMESLTVW